MPDDSEESRDDSSSEPTVARDDASPKSPFRNRRRLVALSFLVLIFLIMIPIGQVAFSLKKDYDNPYTRTDVTKLLPVALGVEGSKDRPSANQSKLLKAESRLLSGNFELDRRRFDRAEKLFREALDSLLVYPGKENILTYMAYSRLARSLEEQDKNVEAEAAYRSALKCAEKTFGPEHRNVAESLRSIAYILSKQKRYGEAKAMYLRALDMDKKGLGDDNLDVAYDLGCIGEMCFKLKEYGAAIDWFRKALPIYQKERGELHPSFTWIAEDLGRALFESGQYNESAEWFESVSKSATTILGASHKDSCRMLAWHAWASAYGDKKDAAFESARKLKAILLKKNVSELDNVDDSLESDADVFVILNSPQEAEDLYEKLLKLQEQRYGAKSPLLCKVLTSLKECNSKIGNKGLANHYADRAKEACR